MPQKDCFSVRYVPGFLVFQTVFILDQCWVDFHAVVVLFWAKNVKRSTLKSVLFDIFTSNFLETRLKVSKSQK